MENKRPIWQCPMKYQNYRAETSHPIPALPARTHERVRAHTHTEMKVFQEYILNQRPKLQLSDSIHLHGPPKQVTFYTEAFFITFKIQLQS